MNEPAVVKLQGITWGHSRGYVPVVAAAQRFQEMNASVDVSWSRRSLQDFADSSLQQLSERFDLLVIDHPWIAHAAEQRMLVPINEYLSAGFLDDLRQHQVGASFDSYSFDGSIWAVPIDAASPVASWRPDLFDAMGLRVPSTWDALIELAQRGHVIMPAIPLDMLGHFNMFCGVHGEDPFRRTSEVVVEEVGVAALESLRRLASLMPPEVFSLNPIQVYEAMASRDDLLYCFSGYGYSNYARNGYAENLLRFGVMVPFSNGRRFRGTLGGAGLAISATCSKKAEAAAYLSYVASHRCQRTLYSENGGQASDRRAWLDTRTNSLCGGYFRDTLPDVDNAFLRPKYNGYLLYQDNACGVVWHYVRDGGDPRVVLRTINDIYRRSRTPDQH